MHDELDDKPSERENLEKMDAEPETAPQPARILLADDLPSIRASVGRLLEREGYQVQQAANGSKAVGLAATGKWDLMLLDLTMPGMDGWAALEKVAAAKPQLPVIVMTAHSSQRPWVEKLGAIGLLEKPIELPLMLASIKEVLGGSKTFTHVSASIQESSSDGFASHGINE